MVFRELSLRQRRAREYALSNVGQARLVSAFVRRCDFEPYLQRRLAKNAARIEAHIVTHGCQA